ncbi:hypothetical protein RFI_33434, partial [Reticulomyxa filosa]
NNNNNNNNNAHEYGYITQNCLVFVPKDIFKIHSDEQMQNIWNKIGTTSSMRWICRVCDVNGEGFKSKEKYDQFGVGAYYFQKHSKFHRKYWKEILHNLRFTQSNDPQLETEQETVRKYVLQLKDILLEFNIFHLDYP